MSSVPGRTVYLFPVISKQLVTLSYIADILRTQLDRVQFTEITINAHENFVLTRIIHGGCRSLSVGLRWRGFDTSVSQSVRRASLHQRQ